MASHAKYSLGDESPARTIDLSIATFACIQESDRYLLGLDRDGMYHPLGGAVKLDDLSRDYVRDFLERDLGVKFKKDDGDLRLLVPEGSLDTLLRQALCWLDDSAIPAGFRELSEELVEYGVLKEPLPRDAVRLKLIRTICVPEVVNREGTPGEFQKLYVAHRVVFKEPLRTAVRAGCTYENGFIFASKYEIEACRQGEDEISRPSWALLENAEDLFRASPLTDQGPASDPDRFFLEEHTLDDSS